MERTRSSYWLKAAVLIAGMCAAVTYFICIPVLGINLIQMENGVYRHCYWPWLGLIWATAFPVALGLLCGWKFAANLGMNCMFCTQNAHLLQWIATLSAGDGVLFFIGNVLLLLLGLSHISVLLVSVFVMLATFVIALAVTVLAQLMQEAADLQKAVGEEKTR